MASQTVGCVVPHLICGRRLCGLGWLVLSRISSSGGPSALLLPVLGRQHGVLQCVLCGPCFLQRSGSSMVNRRKDEEASVVALAAVCCGH
jgi:hypothetical protein